MGYDNNKKIQKLLPLIKKLNPDKQQPYLNFLKSNTEYAQAVVKMVEKEEYSDLFSDQFKNYAHFWKFINATYTEKENQKTAIDLLNERTGERYQQIKSLLEQEGAIEKSKIIK